MHQKKFDNLKPGDLVGLKHKKETIGLVTRSRKVGRSSLIEEPRYAGYTEVTINWRDEGGSFIGIYAGNDNLALERLRIIVKAKNNENDK